MTEAAITDFRKVHGVTDTVAPGAHAITPSGKTMAKLSTLATKALGDVRALPGSPVPYMPVPVMELANSALSWTF